MTVPGLSYFRIYLPGKGLPRLPGETTETEEEPKEEVKQEENKEEPKEEVKQEENKEEPKEEVKQEENKEEPYYFCRVCNGKDNESFWDEIYKYLNDKYDLSKVKKIYLNSDGGSWIKSGMKRLEGITYVLDEYHIEKYLMKLTSHMLDSQSDARDELRYVIRKKTKTEFNELVDRLETYLKDETGMKRMEEARKYITSNWTAAKLRLRHRDGVKGCSAEGHVSHILSSRMSSRPMGWSIKGASKMAQMRAYYVNGGDMLELVRHQKKELPIAVGAEYDVLSSLDIIRSEKNRHGQLGKYIETFKNTIPLEIKKKAYFQSHVWNL